MDQDKQARIQQQLATIRSHTTACAYPAGFVGDVKEHLQHVWRKQKEGLVCAAIMKMGKRNLLSYDGEKFTTIDISDVPDKDLVNKAASQDQTFDQVQEKLVHFRHIFKSGRTNSVTFTPLTLTSTNLTSS